METASTKAQQRRSMTVFSAASFLNDFGSDMIYPVWPLFVTAFAGANIAVLGLIDGVGDAIVSLSQAGSGYLSDRIRKRKVFVWLGYLFGATSRLGYAVSAVWQHLIPLRVLDRSGKMRGAPRDAMVADISTDQNRGRNFGILRAMDNLGAVFGIVTCLTWLGIFGLDALRTLFLLASLPSFIGATLIFIFIQDRKTSQLYRGLALKDLTFNFRLFLLLSSVFALGSFSYSFLLVYLQDPSLRITTLPLFLIQALFYLIFTVAASVMSFPFGWLADKVGRRAVLILSFVFWGLVCLGFTYANSLLFFGLLFVVYGLHKAAIEPVQKALVSELSPVDYRASTLGAFQMIIGLFAFPASFLAGLLWTSFGKSTPFHFSLVMTTVATILLFFIKENRKAA